MASLWVTEYRSRGNNGFPSLPPAAVQVGAISAAASTLSLGANTQLIDVSADVGGWLLVTSSTSVAVATATNAVRIPANSAPKTYDVAPNSRICFIST